MTLPVDADRLLATLRDGAWLDAQVFPPLAYAVPGLVPEGSVLLVGAPKIGKSWLALSIALAAADGGKALGLDVPKRPVLYAALEDGDRRLQERCRRLLADDPIPPEFQYLTRVEPGRVADTIAAWVQFRAEPWSSWTPSARSCRRPCRARRPTSATIGSAPRSSGSWITPPARRCSSTIISARPAPRTSSTPSPAPLV
jgi:AAA domain